VTLRRDGSYLGEGDRSAARLWVRENVEFNSDHQDYSRQLRIYSSTAGYMRLCRQCGNQIPGLVVIDGKRRNLKSRTKCLSY